MSDQPAPESAAEQATPVPPVGDRRSKTSKPGKNLGRRASDKAAAQQQRARRGAGCLGALLNVLAALLLLLSCAGLALVVLLFQYPNVLAFVPGGSRYMPATDVPISAGLITAAPAGTAGPAATSSNGQGFPTLPPIWTPSDTPTITPTPQPGTPSPEPSGTDTATLTPTVTNTKPSPTPTRKGPTPTASRTRSPFSYTLQAGSPTYLANFLNTAGCNWFGIAGRAFGQDGNPVINLSVHLQGGSINADVVTGSGPTAMGPGAYQIPISDHPVDTTDVYKIQLRNNTGTPLSEVYSLNTFGDCSKNLIMVNFVQNH